LLQLFIVAISYSLGTDAQECGLKGADATPWNKIVNGQSASSCEWKWQVSLRRWGSHFCGGSLISDQWVLSAAHCFEDGWTGDAAVVGDFEQNSNGDAFQEEHEIADVLIHPSWNTNSMNYDFALIRLRTPVTFNSCVGPVCLPESDVTEETECMITGWGTLESDGNSPNSLHEGSITTMTNADCDNKYSGGIFASMLCAQGETSSGYVDACQGDSGGPLVCKDDASGKWILHGATSWGYGCADRKYPGVYARVSKVVDWIRATMSTPAGTPVPTPAPATPVCQGNAALWNAGYGVCATYAVGQNNHEYCSSDLADGYLAAQVCVQCGVCSATSSSTTQAPTCQMSDRWLAKKCSRRCIDKGKCGAKMCKRNCCNACASTPTSAPTCGKPDELPAKKCSNKCTSKGKCGKKFCKTKCCNACAQNSRRLQELTPELMPALTSEPMLIIGSEAMPKLDIFI